jgi:hypothetical protein
MKYATARPYADPEKAARRILEIANAVEPVQGRIHIEKINEPFLYLEGLRRLHHEAAKGRTEPARMANGNSLPDRPR